MPGFRFGKKYGPNKKAYRCQCEWCGVWFKAARMAYTCSPTHRTALARYTRRYAAFYGTAPAIGPRGEQVSALHLLRLAELNAKHAHLDDQLPQKKEPK